MVDGKRWWVGACSKTVSVLAFGPLLGGCGSGDAMGPLDADEAGATASVDVALTTVPTSTQCIRLTTTPAVGAATINTFSVTAGSSSASLTIGKLMPGSYTVAGEAFNATCASITGVADWVADPVPATMKTGVATSITLNFRKSNPLKAAANFVNNVLAVVVGNATTYVATDAGLLTSGWQAVGTGSTTFYRRTFAMFDGTAAAGNTITSLAATYGGACAARADGTVWCWGTNYTGELGPGIPLNNSQATPVQLTGLSNVRQLVGGDGHMCAVTYADAASCWGRNDKGQLGNGTTTNSTTPVALGGPVRTMAAGLNSTYMVRGDGSVAAWGANNYGQLGDGTTTDSTLPRTIPGETPTQSVTAGRWHACSQRVDGSVRCWGSNQNGQLGNGTTTNSPTPVLVNGLTPPPKQVVAASDHTCAINDAGYPYCWGNNVDGILADQSVTNRTSPSRVGGVVGGVIGGATHDVQFTSLGSGGLAWHECGITTESELWCWGENNYGQLGDGTTLNPFVPIKPLLQ